MCIKPFLNQQALLGATENTYIHLKHKHLPTFALHWKYLKKFYVKRKLYFSFKEKNHASVAGKKKYWGGVIFFKLPPPPIWRIFLSCFLPPLYKIWRINQRGGGSSKNIAPPWNIENMNKICPIGRSDTRIWVWFNVEGWKFGHL